jgi:hypothetical protein
VSREANAGKDGVLIYLEIKLVRGSRDNDDHGGPSEPPILSLANPIPISIRSYHARPYVRTTPSNHYPWHLR